MDNYFYIRKSSTITIDLNNFKVAAWRARSSISIPSSYEGANDMSANRRGNISGKGCKNIVLDKARDPIGPGNSSPFKRRTAFTKFTGISIRGCKMSSLSKRWRTLELTMLGEDPTAQ
jgi:hypothetical protein